MEYPNSKFKRSLRLTLLLIFIIAFFIISPLIILYSAGYRYDWKHGLLKETGAISIDVLPENALVYLNNTNIKKKMPIRLKNLTPNKYHLKITAPDYYDWTKDIEVKNKQTEYIKDITLLKKEEPKIILEKDVDVFGLSPDGSYIIYSLIKSDNTEIWVENLIDKTNVLAFVLPTKQKIKITWAKKHNHAVINEDRMPYENIFILDPKNPTKPFELSKKIQAPITKIQWREDFNPQLFFSTTEKIISISPTTGQSTIIGANVYLDWFMENDKLWTMVDDPNSKTDKIIKDTLGFASEFSVVENSPEAENERKQWKMMLAHKEHVLLKKNNHPEMILFTTDKKYNISGEKFLISEHNDWWLIWTPWELWTYNPGEEPYLLNRSGEQLQEVIPMDEYNTLALIWAEKISAIFPYYLVSHDLLQATSASTFIDETKRTIYLNAKINETKAIWSLKY